MPPNGAAVKGSLHDLSLLPSEEIIHMLENVGEYDSSQRVRSTMIS